MRLAVTLILLQAGDVLTTWYVVHWTGTGREGNPLMASIVTHHFWLAVLLKIGWTALFLWTIPRLSKPLAAVGWVLALSISAAVLISNMMVVLNGF